MVPASLPNWRIVVLQAANRAQVTVAFHERLFASLHPFINMGMSNDEFDDDDKRRGISIEPFILPLLVFFSAVVSAFLASSAGSLNDMRVAALTLATVSAKSTTRAVDKDMISAAGAVWPPDAFFSTSAATLLPLDVLPLAFS